MTSWQRALAECDARLGLKPADPALLDAKGTVLAIVGRMHDAAELFRRAVERRPDHPDYLSNYLFALNYVPGVSRSAALSWHLRYGCMFPAPKVQHDNAPDPDRPLRIGYLSGLLRRHSAFHFINPILKSHDRANFDIYCYSYAPVEDRYTAKLRSYSLKWRNISAMSDEQATSLIRRDGIDILVENGGHGAASRLAILASRAAPVQISAPDYPNTTGLSQVDYALSDSVVDPPGDSEPFYTEQILRLPTCYFCYSPHANAPKPQVRVASAGRLTFASWHGGHKLNRPTIRLWSEVLKRLPKSRLLLHHVFEGVSDVSSDWREPLVRMFNDCGLSSRRLEFVGHLPLRQHLQLLSEADLALDALPWNSITSLCESLWMGVPTLTLTGDRSAGRNAASLLCAAGLPEFITRTPAGFIQTAVRFAREPEILASLKTGIRERVSRSPLFDGQRYTRELEAAYRTAWRAWCSRHRRPMKK